MKAQHLLLFTPAITTTTTHAFVGISSVVDNNPHRRLASSSSSTSLSESRRRGVAYTTDDIDIDVTGASSSSSPPSIDFIDDAELFNAIIANKKNNKKQNIISIPRHDTLREAEQEHGMPWKSSIDTNVETDDDDGLLYMKFWEWQMDFMEEHLTELKVESCTNDDTGRDFSLNVNEKKKARIVSICGSSKEYRKIRMTYYDAGETTQVYNSVWYPNPEYNLPVLGIDLLAFNSKKFLAIVDFQPIHDSEDDHAKNYEHLLQPIKDKYDSLKGRMSSKFYDETKHFSQQMLFARFDDEDIVNRDLFPAFQSYVQTHLDLIRSTEPNKDPRDVDAVTKQIQKYDTYSADRDPATGLFAAMYGKDWAEDFVHNFLFDTSDGITKSEEEESDESPPPQSSGGKNPFASMNRSVGNGKGNRQP